MKQHPLSAAFPAMSADEYQSLKDSISNAGVLNPITTFEGMVLDGWNRYSAANELGMDCPSVELDGTDPQDFVIAQNKTRRHIEKGQIALAVAAVYQWRPHGDQRSAPGADRAKTTAEMASIAGVGTRTMEQAKTVEAKAAPKVKEAVKAGTISVKRAAEIAQLPAKDQGKALKAPKPAVEEPEYFGPSEAELAAAMADADADMTALHKLLESDDKLATLAAENKQLRAELAVTKLSRDGFMNRCNEQISRITSLKKQLDKAKAAHV